MGPDAILDAFREYYMAMNDPEYAEKKRKAEKVNKKYGKEIDKVENISLKYGIRGLLIPMGISALELAAGYVAKLLGHPEISAYVRPSAFITACMAPLTCYLENKRGQKIENREREKLIKKIQNDPEMEL